MRWVFLSTMLSTLVGTTIIGSALAWNGSEGTELATINAGAVEALITYTPNGTAVGPADGQFKAVGTGSVAVDGAFSMRYVSHEMKLTGVTGAAGDCSLDWFQGQIFPFLQLTTQQITRQTPIPIAFRVDIAALPGAPAGCDGAAVSFELLFTFSAVSPDPA